VTVPIRTNNSVIDRITTGVVESVTFDGKLSFDTGKWPVI